MCQYTLPPNTKTSLAKMNKQENNFAYGTDTLEKRRAIQCAFVSNDVDQLRLQAISCRGLLSHKYQAKAWTLFARDIPLVSSQHSSLVRHNLQQRVIKHTKSYTFQWPIEAYSKLIELGLKENDFEHNFELQAAIASITTRRKRSTAQCATMKLDALANLMAVLKIVTDTEQSAIKLLTHLEKPLMAQGTRLNTKFMSLMTEINKQTALHFKRKGFNNQDAFRIFFPWVQSWFCSPFPKLDVAARLVDFFLATNPEDGPVFFLVALLADERVKKLLMGAQSRQDLCEELDRLPKTLMRHRDFDNMIEQAVQTATYALLKSGKLRERLARPIAAQKLGRPIPFLHLMTVVIFVMPLTAIVV